MESFISIHPSAAPLVPLLSPDDMKPISPRVILLLLSFTSLVAAAANFTRCLEIFKENPNATGGVDAHGRDVSAAQAVGLKYETCTQLCGRTAEKFSWRQFAQLFNSWLLPWFALVSQLPFGSTNHIDDFVSGWPSFYLIAGLITHSRTPPHSISFHERWVPRFSRILPHGHLFQRSHGL